VTTASIFFSNANPSSARQFINLRQKNGVIVCHPGQVPRSGAEPASRPVHCSRFSLDSGSGFAKPSVSGTGLRHWDTAAYERAQDLSLFSSLPRSTDIWCTFLLPSKPIVTVSIDSFFVRSRNFLPANTAPPHRHNTNALLNKTGKAAGLLPLNFPPVCPGKTMALSNALRQARSLHNPRS